VQMGEILYCEYTLYDILQLWKCLWGSYPFNWSYLLSVSSFLHYSRSPFYVVANPSLLTNNLKRDHVTLKLAISYITLNTWNMGILNMGMGFGIAG
jgi:hypothetical protein